MAILVSLPEQQRTITMAEDGSAAAAIMSSAMPDPLGVVDSLDEDLYDDPSLRLPSETSDADDSLTEAATLDYSLPPSVPAPASSKAEESGAAEKAEPVASTTATENNNNNNSSKETAATATTALSSNNPPDPAPDPDPSISLLDDDDEFDNNIDKDIGVSQDDDDTFDPFQIESTAKTKRRSSRLKKLFGASGNSKTSSENKNNSNNQAPTQQKKGVMLLPPRLEVKFKVSEEVTSHPSFTNPNEGACDVRITGTVFAQQTSSDALKNSPFVLIPSSLNRADNMDFVPNEEYCKLYATQAGQETSKINVIKIPKSAKQPGYVFIGKYTIVETVDHMPLVSQNNGYLEK